MIFENRLRLVLSVLSESVGCRALVVVDFFHTHTLSLYIFFRLYAFHFHVFIFPPEQMVSQIFIHLVMNDAETRCELMYRVSASPSLHRTIALYSNWK